MSLRYDFDVITVFADARADAPDPEEASLDPSSAEETSELRLAMFRDPATVDALLVAPDGLRVYLEASGFGLAAHDGGGCDGFYPAEDEEFRVGLIQRLADTLPHADLSAADLTPANSDSGAFDLTAFLESLEHAIPVADLPAEAAAETPEDVDGAQPDEQPEPRSEAESDFQPKEDTNPFEAIFATRMADAKSQAEDAEDLPELSEARVEDLDIVDDPDAIADDKDMTPEGEPAPLGRARKSNVIRIAAGVTVLAGLVIAAPLVLDEVLPLISVEAISDAR